MQKHSIVALLLLLIISCKEPADNTNTHTTASKTASAVDENVQLNTFVEIDSSGILMFPLSAKGTRQNEVLTYRSSYANYWNIIFYNTAAKTSRLLTQRKIVVDGYEIVGDPHRKDASPARHIFYTARTADANADNKLTVEDPQYLFVSDGAGHNFRQLSPPGYHLQSWKYRKIINKVVLTACKDTNNDGKYNDKDAAQAFEITMDNATATPLFRDTFTNQVKALYKQHGQ